MPPGHRLPIFALAILISPVFGAQPRPGAPDARMAWLDNGVVKLGCDLGFGGAITWFSLADGPNVISNHDAGRQVQLSFFSGPVPFTSHGQEPAPHWKHLGWNPIQAGDDFGHGSRVTDHEISPDGTRLHLRCVPLQWPLNQVEGDCGFTIWIGLHGATAVLRGRLENHRNDKTWYPARHQELPAVYTTARFHRLFTYAGDRPFSGDPLVEISGRPEGSHPWHFWSATERWSALVDDAGWGLGVWNPGTTHFTGGFAGTPGDSGTYEASTGYLSPLRTELLDAEIRYDFSCDLILGTVEEIRAHVQRRSTDRTLPSWTFDHSREGWHYGGGLTDAGWPIAGALHFPDVAPGHHLLSPETFWRAEDAPRLRIRARHEGPDGPLHIHWRRLGERAPDRESHLTARLAGDNQPHDLIIDLSGHAAYRGGLIQLVIDPPEGRFDLEEVELFRE